jgi:sugar/nucleoside kinase (ribokinase family)
MERRGRCAVVVAGNLTLDDTVMPDGRTVMAAVGGDVLYAALGAALWTRPVGLLSRYGEDFPSAHLARVRDAGLDTAGLVACPGPTIRYWVLYEWDGRRHFIFRTAPDRFHALSPEPSDLPPAYADATLFHVAALPFEQVDRLVRAAAASLARPLITLDTHEDFVAGYQDRLARLLPLLAAFLPSREEVALWFGDDDPERHIGELLALGPRMVAIKMGPDGVLLQRGGWPRPVWLPPVGGPVVDVTGAGDAFCGGFAARLAMGADILDAARAGLVSASFAIEGYGALGLAEVRREERDARLATLVEGKEQTIGR